jgi:quinol monooxygenase YgiN
MTLNVVATIDAKPEHVATVENALREMLVPTRAEPGCLQYELNRDLDQPTRLMMIERWSDEAALERHTATPHMARLRRALDGWVERTAISRLAQLG